MGSGLSRADLEGRMRDLVEVLFRESDLAGAKPHVQFLLTAMPDSTQVKRMWIAILLDESAPKEEIQKQYASLPEKTRVDQLDAGSP